MSRVIAAVRGTPQRLDTEQRAIDAVEREIGELEQQRASALLAEDPADAVRLAERIAAARARLQTHRDRLRALQGQRRREQSDDRQRRKIEALQATGELLKARSAAAARVDAAIAELAESLKAYRKARRAPFDAWPAEFPRRDIYASLARDSASARIGGALRMQSIGAAHELLTRLGERLGSLAEADAASAAELIDDIRNAPLPADNSDEEIAA